MYALNIEGMKAGSVYGLNKEYVLNNGVRLTTRVYGKRNIYIYRISSIKHRLLKNAVPPMYTGVTA